MMYTITRGPSKLVTQRRTDGVLLQSLHLASSSRRPKLVFQRMNGKRYHRSTSPKDDSTEESFTPAHEENVKFVYEAWQEVEQMLGEGAQPENGKGPVQYAERSPNPSMKNFVPIDLEEWWAQRFLANIANLS
uniref:Uncharacterized protein n=1 Tax=Electrophorus electricus TaxID=8005 RepID=A0AAY5E844_ELEEL